MTYVPPTISMPRHVKPTATIASVVLCLALAGILAILLAGLSMNSDALNTQRQLIDNAVSQDVVEALNEIQSIAFWDVAAEKTTTSVMDVDWFNNEIGQYLSKMNGHDAVWILDQDNKPVYGYEGGRQLPPSSLQPYGGELAELVRIVRSGKEDGRRIRDANIETHRGAYPGSLGSNSRGRWSSHIIGDAGEAVILTVMTIVPVTERVVLRQRPHLIVSAVKINEQRIQTYADTLLINGLHVRPLTSSHKYSGTYILTDDKGQPIVQLVWASRRPGRILLQYVLPLFVIVTAIAAFLLVATFRRMQKMTISLIDKEREASFLANFDPLSSLPNRRLFMQHFNKLLAPHLIDSNPAMVAFCDIDNFKTVNDTWGHEVGDVLIKTVAKRLRNGFPDSVLVSRFGGDEFALVHAEKWLSVEDFGNRIQRAFAEPFDLAGKPSRIGVSVGIAIAPDHGRASSELLRNADIGLYEAKDGGRARCAVYHRGMHDQIVVRKERETRIQDALEASRFELHYQPIVDIRSACVCGMEALLRWPADDAAAMPPAEFIPIAERAGLMPILGDWIISQAFRDSLRWPGLWVSINLSPLQISTAGLITTLSRELRISGADPAHIMFEITEGLLLNSTADTRKTFDAIRAMGFKIGLDDFGTGYSSLSYLQDFTFDKLKIDRSFICDGKLQDPRSASLVKAVIDVGRALGIEVVAEGVEYLSEARILQALGCYQFQGWLYGRALPPIKATDHVRELNTLVSQGFTVDPVASLRVAK